MLNELLKICRDEDRQIEINSFRGSSSIQVTKKSVLLEVEFRESGRNCIDDLAHIIITKIKESLNNKYNACVYSNAWIYDDAGIKVTGKAKIFPK